MEREYNYFRDEDDYGNLDLVEVFSEEEGFQDNLDADTLKLLKSFKWAKKWLVGRNSYSLHHLYGQCTGELDSLPLH